MVDVQGVISAFGASAKAKLNSAAIAGAPEDQLRAPLETMVTAMAELIGLPPNAVKLIGETTLAGMQTRPDYAITVHNALVGFIEVKAPGKGFDPRKFSGEHDKTQWGKLKSLPNVLYTDGNGFALFHNGEIDGKPVALEGDIESSGAKLAAPNTLTALFSSFLHWKPDPPKNAAALAKTSARLCRLMRDEVMEHLAHGEASLKALHKDWRSLLFPNADDAQFADGYAQAVTFGLLIARAQGISLNDGVDMAVPKLRKANTLIGTALGLLTQNEANQKILETSLGTMLRVLNEVDWAVISKDKPDAWLYFYEDFLSVYDNTLRKKTGSYYTPPEVVNAMVRLVDEALKSDLFDRAAGLASSDVTVADPAVGTGTFLLGVLRQIAANAQADQGEGAVKGAIAAAAKRLFGFELQFGPYAVAQLRLLAEMRALMGAKDTDSTTPEINLYITDTLGNPFVEDEQLGTMVEAVAVSRREANKVKRGQPITVVIGNPPYKEKAEGMGGWIEQGSDGKPAPMDWWKPPHAWGVGVHTKRLKNLYIFFWRWAAMKVFGKGLSIATSQPEKDEEGLICFITVAGFLLGPGFERMRDDLRRTCSNIWVIDCSPEGHQPEVPTRIFEAVQPPVCIVMAARKLGKDETKPAIVKYRSLQEGKREEKFIELQKIRLDSKDWQECPKDWRAPFLPAFKGQWSEFAQLGSLFIYNGSGVMPGRTWIIAPDIETLELRWKKLVTEKDILKKELLFHPHLRNGKAGDKHVNKLAAEGFSGHEFRSSAVATDNADLIKPSQFGFRYFDRQWIVPDVRLINQPNPKIWRDYSAQQIFITGLHAHVVRSGSAISISSLIPDLNYYQGSFGGRVYPLYANAAATQSNFRPELLALLAKAYGQPVSPEDVMAYIAAVMAHPAFTARFAKDLIRPGLRLPLTASTALFQEAAALGREVIWLHSYGERFVDASAGRPKGAPRMEKSVEPTIPAKGEIPATELPDDLRYDAATRRLHVGKGYVDNVSPEIFNYDVSGKQVVKQWFSYRKRDRTKPIIGDRRPPSPLEKIHPEGWLPEYTTDLLNLLRVLGRVVALEPAQAGLLTRICDGGLIPVAKLREAGLMEASDEADDAE